MIPQKRQAETVLPWLGWTAAKSAGHRKKRKKFQHTEIYTNKSFYIGFGGFSTNAGIRGWVLDGCWDRC